LTVVRRSPHHQGRRHIAKEIELEDKFENMGAQIVRGPPEDQRHAGDGMCHHVLAHSISGRCKALAAAPDGPQAQHRHGRSRAVADLKRRSKKIKTSERSRKSARSPPMARR
jgi:hypothetical protein